jgi:MOSC domain-containing protein YiiM
VQSVLLAQCDPRQGLVGDRYCGGSGNRQVTLIQAEHLAAIAAYLGRADLPPDLLRRNIVVRGLNLLALQGQRFQLGSAVLQGTGLCHPCSRMEDILGVGGYNAVRGHGGITARVLQAGTVTVGEPVTRLGEGGASFPSGTECSKPA